MFRKAYDRENGSHAINKDCYASSTLRHNIIAFLSLQWILIAFDKKTQREGGRKKNKIKCVARDMRVHSNSRRRWRRRYFHTKHSLLQHRLTHTPRRKHKYKVKNERVKNNHFSNWYANKFHVRGRAPATPYTHTDTHPQRERCECLRGAWGYRCVNFRRIVFSAQNIRSNEWTRSLVSTHTQVYFIAQSYQLQIRQTWTEYRTAQWCYVTSQSQSIFAQNDQIDAGPGISFLRFQPDSGCLIIVIMLSFRN